LRLETDRNSYHQNPSDYQIQFIDGKNWVVWCNTIKWCLQKKTMVHSLSLFVSVSNSSYQWIHVYWCLGTSKNVKYPKTPPNLSNYWAKSMALGHVPFRRLERLWDLEIPMANFRQRCVWTRQHTWHSPRTRSICFHHRDPLGASKWTDQMLKMQRILGTIIEQHEPSENHVE
jgi:hypothetical protein